MSESSQYQRVLPRHSPFVAMLGIEVVSIDAEQTVLQLPVRAEFLNSVGVVHGGVYASLADSALGAVIYTSLSPGQAALTMEISCRYLRPAKGEVLIAKARILRLGSRTAVAETDILADGRMLMRATGTFLIQETAAE